MALALGVTVDAIEAMPERRFHEWQIYGAHKMLPQQRTEIMLARIAAQIAAGAGAKDVRVDEYLLKMELDEPKTVTTRPADFNPRGKRKKRAY